MRNLWLVAKHEYRRTVLRRSFILVTLAIPLGLVALVAVIIAIESLGENRSPLGVVDHTGFLNVTRRVALDDGDKGIEIRAFPDEESALVALNSEEIQAFFLLPSDYPDTLQTDLYYLEKPPSKDVWDEFNSFVRFNLVATYSDEVRNRLIEGPDITVRDIVSHREFSENSIINIVIPFLASFFFFVATMSASGYMLQVVASEKENRTLEIIITSVTPEQLIGGKTVGLLGAVLTQLSIDVIAVVIGLLVAAPRVGAIQHLTIPWAYLGVMALLFFPSYGLIATLMVAIGGAVTKVQEGQQVAGILNMFFILPTLLMTVIMENPAHPLIVFLSLFPTTAFMTISLRWGLGTVPLWQVGVSWVLVVGTTIFMMRAAARIFRAGMLRYGQPLTLKSVLNLVLSSVEGPS